MRDTIYSWYTQCHIAQAVQLTHSNITHSSIETMHSQSILWSILFLETLTTVFYTERTIHPCQKLIIDENPFSYSRSQWHNKKGSYSFLCGLLFLPTFNISHSLASLDHDHNRQEHEQLQDFLVLCTLLVQLKPACEAQRNLSNCQLYDYGRMGLGEVPQLCNIIRSHMSINYKLHYQSTIEMRYMCTLLVQLNLLVRHRETSATASCWIVEDGLERGATVM